MLLNTTIEIMFIWQKLAGIKKHIESCLACPGGIVCTIWVNGKSSSDRGEILLVVMLDISEVSLQRCSLDKMCWKYVANLQENIHTEVWFSGVKVLPC